MRNLIHTTMAFLIATLAIANAAWARNPWASAVGEACAVQHRAEDIANRIKRTAPHSHLVRQAMAFDHLACTLVERVKCGAPCNQVQGLYDQLEGTWGQLRVAIYTDPCLCSDRTLKSLADGMDTRMRNLCRAIQRVVEREFRCAPAISYQVPPGFGLPAYSSSQLRIQSNRVPYGVPSNSIHFGVPSYSHRVAPYQSHRFGAPGFPSSGFPSSGFPSHGFHEYGLPTPNRSGLGWNQPSWPGEGFGGSGPWRAF